MRTLLRLLGFSSVRQGAATLFTRNTRKHSFQIWFFEN